MKYMDIICWLSYVLVIIGALNWGLYGMERSWDLVALVLGDYTIPARTVYVLVGISGLISLATMLQKK